MGFMKWFKLSGRGIWRLPTTYISGSSSSSSLAPCRGHTDLIGRIVPERGEGERAAPQWNQEEDDDEAEPGSAIRIETRLDIIREVLKGQMTANEIARRYELTRRSLEEEQQGQGEAQEILPRPRTPSRWERFWKTTQRSIRFIWMILVCRQRPSPVHPEPAPERGQRPLLIDLPVTEAVAQVAPPADLEILPRYVDPRIDLKVNHWLDKNEPFWNSVPQFE